jgi:hypothetical protein
VRFVKFFISATQKLCSQETKKNDLARSGSQRKQFVLMLDESMYSSKDKK